MARYPFETLKPLVWRRVRPLQDLASSNIYNYRFRREFLDPGVPHAGYWCAAKIEDCAAVLGGVATSWPVTHTRGEKGANR
jgi:hypothetical protein